MTGFGQNPYASPQPDAGYASPEIAEKATMAKIEAIIKDAGQFWLAILLCIFCSALGSLIIGPWYFVRLLQWNSIARAQPMLLEPTVPKGSIAQRFQTARIRLIIGIGFGVLMVILVLLYVVATIVLVSNQRLTGEPRTF